MNSYLSNKRRVANNHRAANNRRVWKKYLNLINEGTFCAKIAQLFEEKRIMFGNRQITAIEGK